MYMSYFRRFIIYKKEGSKDRSYIFTVHSTQLQANKRTPTAVKDTFNNGGRKIKDSHI